MFKCFLMGRKKKFVPDAENCKWEVFYEVVLLISFNHYVISIPRKISCSLLCLYYSHCNYFTIWLSCKYDGSHITSCTWSGQSNRVWSSISRYLVSKCMIPRPVHPVVMDRDYCAIINVRKCFSFFSYTQTLARQACRSRSCFDGLDEVEDAAALLTRW